MVTHILVDLYRRDLRRLIEEINLFHDERNLWRVTGGVENSCGNLVLHIVGGMNFLIGTRLGGSEYVRDRDQEFLMKDVPRTELVAQLEELIRCIESAVGTLTPHELEAEYPAYFDTPQATNQYVLMALLAHLNYHLGQVNYLRRIIES